MGEDELERLRPPFSSLLSYLRMVIYGLGEESEKEGKQEFGLCPFCCLLSRTKIHKSKSFLVFLWYKDEVNHYFWQSTYVLSCNVL